MLPAAGCAGARPARTGESLISWPGGPHSACSRALCARKGTTALNVSAFVMCSGCGVPRPAAAGQARSCRLPAGAAGRAPRLCPGERCSRVGREGSAARQPPGARRSSGGAQRAARAVGGRTQLQSCGGLSASQQQFVTVEGDPLDELPMRGSDGGRAAMACSKLGMCVVAVVRGWS